MRRDPLLAGISLILMTGQADAEGMRRGMEHGADDYLAKPFTIEALLATVEAPPSILTGQDHRDKFCKMAASRAPSRRAHS